MSPNLTPDQIEKLRALGISVDPSVQSPVPTPPPIEISAPLVIPQNIAPEKNSTLTITTLPEMSLIQKPIINLPKSKLNSFLPLLSISGITIISFSGIILLKNQNSSSSPVTTFHPASEPVAQNVSVTPGPQVQPIQSFLLSSQQYFTQALQLQKNGTTNNEQVVNLLNQSILAASDAIKNYPDDYRGPYQRGRIYQSLIDSKPEFMNQALADFTAASKLNPDSADVTRDLAALFARKGDVSNTLDYLTKTVSLEPTKAQNFYDLAKIQQQTGRIQDALSTYNRLIPLLTDPSQLAQVQAEKTTLEQIIAQNPNLPGSQLTLPSSTPKTSDIPISFPDDPPKLQASASSGLIIAAPETSKKIEVDNVTNSNSLSGTATLAANAKNLTLDNSNLKTTSQVYLTLLKGGKNQTLKVLSKSGTSFTVGFDTPLSENVEFKWWIIN